MMANGKPVPCAAILAGASQANTRMPATTAAPATKGSEFVWLESAPGLFSTA